MPLVAEHVPNAPLVGEGIKHLQQKESLACKIDLGFLVHHMLHKNQVCP